MSNFKWNFLTESWLLSLKVQAGGFLTGADASQPRPCTPSLALPQPPPACRAHYQPQLATIFRQTAEKRKNHGNG